MRLSLWLPEAEVKEFPAALNLARVATVFRQTVSDAGERGYVAEFSDMLESLDVVVLLMEQAAKLTGVRFIINDRPVTRPIQFWSALLCYWESLSHNDPRTYCLNRSARVSDVSGCPNQAVCLTASSSARAAWVSCTNLVRRRWRVSW